MPRPGTSAPRVSTSIPVNDDSSNATSSKLAKVDLPTSSSTSVKISIPRKNSSLISAKVDLSRKSSPSTPVKVAGFCDNSSSTPNNIVHTQRANTQSPFKRKRNSWTLTDFGAINEATAPEPMVMLLTGPLKKPHLVNARGRPIDVFTIVLSDANNHTVEGVAWAENATKIYNELIGASIPCKVRIEHARLAACNASFVPRTDYKSQLKLGDATITISDEEVKKPRIVLQKATIFTLTEEITRLFIGQKFDKYIILETVNAPLIKNGKCFVTVCDGVHKAHLIAPANFSDILSGDEAFRINGFTAGFVTNFTGSTVFTITASEEIAIAPNTMINYADEHEIVFPPLPPL